MANIYYSSLYSQTTPGQTTGTPNSGQYVYRATFTLTVPATASLVNDLHYLAPIPFRCKLDGWFIDFPATDSSTGLVWALGDVTNGATAYASGLTTGRSSAGGFHYPGATGTVAGILGTQSAVYTVKQSARINRSAADDFILKVTTAPTTAIATARVISGWVDFSTAQMSDTQG